MKESPRRPLKNQRPTWPKDTKVRVTKAHGGLKKGDIVYVLLPRARRGMTVVVPFIGSNDMTFISPRHLERV